MKQRLIALAAIAILAAAFASVIRMGLAAWVEESNEIVRECYKPARTSPAKEP